MGLPALGLEEPPSPGGWSPALGLTRLLLPTSPAPGARASRGRCSPGNELPESGSFPGAVDSAPRVALPFFAEGFFPFVPKRARFVLETWPWPREQGRPCLRPAGLGELPPAGPTTRGAPPQPQLFPSAGHRHSDPALAAKAAQSRRWLPGPSSQGPRSGQMSPHV